MKILLPPKVEFILQKLQTAGFEAYTVGGCVRDSLLGRVPQDWDVCTSALPSQVIGCFGKAFTLPTGLKHGTVTVLLEGEAFEITTFRVDGRYGDGRHPDEVSFVSSLEADLARRDFTINAMAYHPARGLVDPFGGERDLAAGVLRCVGAPQERFAEDALRILRAVRFAAVYELKIEPATEAALRQLAARLDGVSKERVTAELFRLLLAPAPGAYLQQNKQVLFRLLPELKACDGFSQNSLWHEFDVLTHLLRAVDRVQWPAYLSAEEFAAVRLAALLHDVAKPACYLVGKDGRGHFYGHPEVGARQAKTIMAARLRLPSRIARQVELLIREHEMDFVPNEKSVRRWLAKVGPQPLCLLVTLRKADLLAQGENAANYRASMEEYAQTAAFERLLLEFKPEKACLAVTDLKINGHDLLAMGAEAGPDVGALLRKLLEEVLEDTTPNQREVLLARARELLARPPLLKGEGELAVKAAGAGQEQPGKIRPGLEKA